MYNFSQRFTALLLLFSITLQSCYTPLKMSNKKFTSAPKVSFNSAKSGKPSSSNDSNVLEIVQSEIDWLEDEDDPDNLDKEKQVIEYQKTESQESPVSSQISSEEYENQEELPTVSFYQKDGVWKAKLEETSGSLQRSENLDVVCSPGIDLEALNHMPKSQSKQLIHRIKHPKKDFIYLGKMGLAGGMSSRAPKAKQELEEKEEKKEEIPFPLHEAVSRIDLKKVINLVEQGFNVNEENELGDTPYDLAQKSGHQELIDILLNAGATARTSLQPQKVKNDLPHSAVQAFDKAKVQKSEKKSNGSEDKDGDTPLHLAAYTGNIDKAEELIKSGAEINQKNKFGVAPLHKAADKGHTKMVELLIEKGAEINLKNDFGATPLHRAAFEGHIEVAKLLVDKGADINKKSDHNMTLLHWAAHNGHIDVAKLLIDGGADVSAKNKSGATPLHLAAYKGHTEVAKILLKADADLNAKDKDDWTPLRWADFNKDKDMKETLVKDYENSIRSILRKNNLSLPHLPHKEDEVLFWSLENNQPDLAKWLLRKAGASANAKDKDGRTPLHIATKKGQEEVARFLITKGANVNIKDKAGRTPLHVAVQYARKELAELLIAKGADILAKDKDGNTPLHLAAAPEIAALLSKAVPLIRYEEVAASLRKYYQKSFSEVKPWFEDDQTPLPIEKSQFQLLALEQKESQEKYSQQEDEKEEKKSSQLREYKQGSFQVETLIELVDLFKPRVIKQGQLPQEVKKVLLVGEPGTGKTTVSHKLAYLWSQGQADQSLQTVYVVPVRELQQSKYDNNGHFKREETLATAITNICFPVINEEEAYKPFRSAIKETLQHPSTLVILDGLDEEYGASKRIISEAQQGNHKLLILSRPYGLEEVRKDIDLEVRHAGFTSEQLKAYIAAYFIGKEEKSSSLLELIANNHMLKSVLHVPVNACMVCAIWQSHEDRLKQYAQRGSLSNLYEQMITYTWERYEEKMNKGKELNEMLNNAEKDGLFHALGCIALEAFENKELGIISSGTVRTVLQKLSRNSLVKAMLKDSGLLLFQEIGIVYQFPHLTFQEYFAGKELARQLFSKDSQEQKLGKAFLSSHKYQSQYQVMLSFMAAEVSEKQGDEGITKLLRIINEGPQDIVGLHQLILELRCLNEYLLLYPKLPEALEKEFECMSRLNKWIQQGLEEVRMYKYKAKLLNILIDALQGMPAVAKEAQGVLELLSVAGDKEGDVRDVAIKALGELVKIAPEHAPKILSTLLNAAVDKDWNVRFAAIKGLGKLVKVAAGHAPEILPTLLRAAVDKDRGVCSSARDALVELAKIAPEHAPKILSTLLNAAVDKDWNVRFAAIRALGDLAKASPDHAPEILPTLLRAAVDKDRGVCSAARDALVELAKVAPGHALEILPTLLSAAVDQESGVRYAAIKALVKLLKASPNQAPEILPILLIAAGDKETFVRKAASDDIDKLVRVASGHATILPLLVRAVGDKDWQVCEAALRGLGELVKVSPGHAPEILPLLVIAVGDENESVRKAAIHALGELVKVSAGHAPKILPLLLNAVGDKNEYVRSAAIKALGELVKVAPGHASEILPTFLSAAGDEGAWVSSAATHALGELVKVSPEHASEILPVLVKAAGAKDFWVSSFAIGALSELVKVAPSHAPEILPTLLSAAGDEKWIVREAAIRALSELVKIAPEHVPKILPVLVKAAGDADYRVRSAARGALEALVKASPGHASEILPVLVKAAGDADYRVSSAAIAALGELVKVSPGHAPEILPLLVIAVGDENESVRKAAIHALVELVKVSAGHAPKILPLLLSAAGDEESWVRSAAIAALGELVKASPNQAPEILRVLLSAAGDEESWVRSAARGALEALVKASPGHASEILPVLVKAAGDADYSVSSAARGALEALVKASPGHASEILSMLLSAAGDKWWVVEAAIRALDSLPLATLMQFYFTNQDEKFLSIVIKRVWNYPIVAQDSKKGYQQLITYPTAGAPEVLGEYPTKEVEKFVEQVVKQVNDEQKE
jgi:ankyrin repeat protein/HEAT repeat protein